MTKADAFAAAQRRANFSKARIVVYRRPSFWRDEPEGENYACTKDREDLPDEWIVIGYVEPEQEH